MIAIAILLGGSLLGWNQAQYLARLRIQEKAVIHECRLLGFLPSDSSDAASIKMTRHVRQITEEKIQALVGEYATIYMNNREALRYGEELDATTMQRHSEIWDIFRAMNKEEISLCMSSIQNMAGLTDDFKANISMGLFDILAKKDPQGALNLFVPLPGKLRPYFQMISQTLATWGTSQPEAAAKWMSYNASLFPEDSANEVKKWALLGIARNDITSAFRQLDQLNISQDHISSAISFAANAAKTPEQQSEFLKSIRDYASNVEDKAKAAKILDEGIGLLFAIVSQGSCEQSMTWINNSDLSDKEVQLFADQLSYHSTKDDTAKWMDWLTSRSATVKIKNDTIENLVRNWTAGDYTAAGTWLSQAAESPVKETATIAYVQAIADYDPEVATQWAGTLPEAKKKKSYNAIYRAIQKKDQAAADAYLLQHGLKR